MAAEFEVHEAFVLESRSVFVLAGAIRDGMVQIGMRATLAGAEQDFTARVHGVEFLDRAAGRPEASEPALTFSYSDADKIARWQAVDWTGKTLQLHW